MPFMPLDPSIYIDDNVIADLVDELSYRLRMDRKLRPVLDKLVGNQWHEFEIGFAEFWRSVVLQTGDHTQHVATASVRFAELTPEDVSAISDVFLEASLRSVPLHTAARFAEISEIALSALNSALRSDDRERSDRLLEVCESLMTGSVLG
jgi:truncated hemoglobin YjbI